MSEVQATYIKNRRIINGPLMVDEIILLKKGKNKSWMFPKIEFEKAL